jgi:hypothetical protein
VSLLAIMVNVLALLALVTQGVVFPPQHPEPLAGKNYLRGKPLRAA